MKLYLPFVYDREDNVGSVYFQEGTKLYTKEEMEEQKDKFEGWEEVEADEKMLRENPQIYVITEGINGVGYGGTHVYDPKVHTKEEKDEILAKYKEEGHKGSGLYGWEYDSPLINTIDIAKLGEKIGMEAKEQPLPNGKVVKSLVWNQENLKKAVNEVAYMSEEGKPVRITGAAPAWLVSALAHTVHPCPVGVYMPQIGKDVDIPQLAHGEANPEGEVGFKVTEKGDSVLIEYNMELPDGITTYDENNLSKVVVPEVTNGKAVYLSGRGPNYLTVAIAEAYAHTNSSVSLFQPGVGYTCSITHTRAKGLGDLTKDPMVNEQVKEQLVTSKNKSPKEVNREM